jgi:hypothetical protein
MANLWTNVLKCKLIIKLRSNKNKQGDKGFCQESKNHYQYSVKGDLTYSEFLADKQNKD